MTKGHVFPPWCLGHSREKERELRENILSVQEAREKRGRKEKKEGERYFGASKSEFSVWFQAHKVSVAIFNL